VESDPLKWSWVFLMFKRTIGGRTDTLNISMSSGAKP